MRDFLIRLRRAMLRISISRVQPHSCRTCSHCCLPEFPVAELSILAPSATTSWANQLMLADNMERLQNPIKKQKRVGIPILPSEPLAVSDGSSAPNLDQDQDVDVRPFQIQTRKCHLTNSSAFQALNIDRSSWIQPEKLRKIGPHPPLFACYRQELCETLEYYRSYHCGVYHINGHARGCLLNGHPSKGDCFEDGGKVIITHAGGGRKAKLPKCDESIALTAFKPCESDWHQHHAVESLLFCLNNQIPIVLLAGEAYFFMPWIRSRYKATYVVLGFYLITHVWPERCQQTQQVKFKFRLQWLSSQGSPWWTVDLSYDQRCQVESTSYQSNANHLFFFENAYESAFCGKKSDGIYCDSSVCSNNKRQEFFHSSTSNFNGKHNLLSSEVSTYSRWFLRYQAHYETDGRVPHSLKPKQILQNLSQTDIVELSFVGAYCERCGRISCRIRWTQFTCPTCEFQVKLKASQQSCVSHPVFSASTVAASNWISRTSDVCSYGITGIPEWQAVVYHLACTDGFIVHARPLVSQTHRLEKLFRNLQVKKKLTRPFQRHRLKLSKTNGMIGQQFTMNYGTPYRFTSEAPTIPWEEAPKDIVRTKAWLEETVNSINTATKLQIPTELSKGLPDEIHFNQILECCYVANSGMNYHSDDEPGVGPIITSLSLGKTATMHFRRKPLNKRSISSSQPATLPMRPLRRNNFPSLRMELRHGDIVIQNGKAIQDSWHHSITSPGFRIELLGRRARVGFKSYLALPAHQGEKENLWAAGIEPAFSRNRVKPAEPQRDFLTIRRRPPRQIFALAVSEAANNCGGIFDEKLRAAAGAQPGQQRKRFDHPPSPSAQEHIDQGTVYLSFLAYLFCFHISNIPQHTASPRPTWRVIPSYYLGPILVVDVKACAQNPPSNQQFARWEHILLKSL
ncbi:hypothetical protein O181_024141 [Austropuccinia psidii MF-1]|uniref:Alpha-ketoglutarate-dependent dioxygenase AlkB-like domain-containing protein n=1 Tax=Austropuccinia psidii MF-1 TaxID=1389203 RepID=A0A9Q3CG44_9BASI|nr:hypothetical protein [Austropuccinia psidii MF-1]